MTRLTDKEKVILSQSKGQTPVIGIDPVRAAASAIFQALRRPFQRAAVTRRLERLDDRMLEDIGVPRWAIPTIAERVASRREPGFWESVAHLAAAVATRFLAWRERRVASRELMALDDRMLRDIGIVRGDIPAVIAAFDVASAAHQFADAAAADRLEGLRRWARSRAVAKDLNGLDNRTLNDIGMVRGDIDWVAEELAFRSLRPANSNHTPQVA